MSQENNTDADFMHIINSDPTMSAKWQAITESVIVTAAELGAEITPEDCLRIPSARIAAMTSEGVDDTFLQRELTALPSYREAQRRIALKAEIEAGEQSGIDALAHLSPSQKMEYARANGLMRGVDSTEQPTKLDPVQEAELIKNIEGLSASARMNIARKFGLGV